MTAVGQVKRAVSAAIKAAGCAAIESYSEEQLKRYATAVAAVGTKETVIEESGAIEYLGEKVDEATQETVSVYGRKMLLTLLIEVYVPRTVGAAGCEEAAEAITQAMMTALPEGLKLRTLQWARPAGTRRRECSDWMRARNMRRTLSRRRRRMRRCLPILY